MELNVDPASSFDSYRQKWLNTTLDIVTIGSQLDASRNARETFVVNICAGGVWCHLGLLVVGPNMD
jgi:hypothetical protein